MKKEYTIQSKHLNKDMKLSVYGKYGFGILLFPSTMDDHNECEKSGLVNAIEQELSSGKCKLFSVDSVNFESWLNKKITPENKSKRHLEYNNFIIEELLPIVFELCGGPVPIFTAGCGLGAYHAANNYFRRPDIFYGTIAISGTYNIEHLTDGYWDDNCYFNSPVHYLPNLSDNYWLSFLLSRKHSYIFSGSGDNEFPDNALNLKVILDAKGITNHVDIWGPEFGHDYESWNKIFKHIVSDRL